MTDLVTVRRDTLLGLLDAAISPPWRGDDENTHKQKLEKALATMIVSPWQPIETIPTDANKPWDERRFWLLYAPEREGLPAMQSVCRYHADAGWCIDELRTATHGQPLPEPPK